MSQLDALHAVQRMRERLVEFSLEEHYLRDPALQQVCRAVWSGLGSSGGLVSELWVEGVYPSEESADTLKELVAEGIFSAELVKVIDRPEAMPATRVLYKHQSRAIRSAFADPQGRWPVLTVTAGTGAGKTESFLLPILDLLYREDRRGPGMQCLILYPMNALVNDQVDRLNRWLSKQSRLRYFHFTSETPEKTPRAQRHLQSSARVLSREDARNEELGTPDIVITNYSMLEYMLCRPQDASFFGAGLRAVVLDEAHLYAGALAAEITMLLRRVYERCEIQSSNVIGIATSATLGGTPYELRDFTATLFSKPVSGVTLIEGQRVIPEWPEERSPESPLRAEDLVDDWIGGPSIRMSPDGESHFADEPEDQLRTSALLGRLPQLLASEVVDRVVQEGVLPAARLLERTLRHSPSVQQLGRLLAEHGRLPLGQLAAELWDGRTDQVACRATTTLLQLSAVARKQEGEYPVIPHRLHALTRQAQGMWVCLSNGCPSQQSPRWPGLGRVFGESATRCPDCGSAVLQLLRCSGCGEWGLLAAASRLRITPEGGYEKSWLIDAGQDPGVGLGKRRTLDPTTGEARGGNAGGLPVWEAEACPACGESDWRPLAGRGPLALSIVGEAFLGELPELPVAYRDFLPAQGRRLLAFSDSRRDAATLGPRLTRNHELQVFRALLVDVLEQATVSATEETYLREEVARLTDLLDRTVEGELHARLDRELVLRRHELAVVREGGTMRMWADRLAKHPELGSLLAVEAGEQHQPSAWVEDAGRERDKNRLEAIASLMGRLGQELAAPIQGQQSIETLGFAAVMYPGIDSCQYPPQLRAYLPDYCSELMGSNWPILLALLCDTVRAAGCITLGSVEADQLYRLGRTPIGRWMGASEPGWFLESFVGTPRSRRQRFFAALLRSAGMEEILIDEACARILQATFDQLHELKVPWLETDTRQAKKSKRAVSAFRLVFPELGMRAPDSLWHCPVSGELWPRHVIGLVPTSRQQMPRLGPTSSEGLDRDPRLGRRRQELRGSPLFRMALWGEEHSAQLAPEENRRRQDLFKLGVRNLLSATTTMELGIDIGGLQGAFITNVPPGIANYLQRAGRVGRRTDGSSLVVTYCRDRSFDQQVFQGFGGFLGRKPRAPRVLLSRERIVKRHLNAWLLGEFYRAYRGVSTPERVGAMRAYGMMASFSGVAVVLRWEYGSPRPALQLQPLPTPSHPRPVWWKPDLPLAEQLFAFLEWAATRRELEARAKPLLEATPLAENRLPWEDRCRLVKEQFHSAVTDWMSLYSEPLGEWLSLPAHGSPQERRTANGIWYQLKELREDTVIGALAERGVLPSYGFPTNVLDLKVFRPNEKRAERAREDKRFGLERAAMLAIAEYVPGSELIVKGEQVKSQGLLKHWTGANINSTPGLRWCLATCENNHPYYFRLRQEHPDCPFCGAPRAGVVRQLLQPRVGFRTAAWDPPSRILEVDRVGQREILSLVGRAKDVPANRMSYSDFAGVSGLVAHYQEDGELLAYNAGDPVLVRDGDRDVPHGSRGFRICLKCGFALPERSRGSGQQITQPPAGFARHLAIDDTGRDTKGRPTPERSCLPREHDELTLAYQYLAANQHTETLWLDFSTHPPTEQSRVVFSSLGVALKLAGTRLLEVDTREIDVLLTPQGEEGEPTGLVLYDTAEGGAGHVQELCTIGRAWLEEAERLLTLDTQHEAQCVDACLRCLLSFDTQVLHAKGLLQRKPALNYLHALLAGTYESSPAKARATASLPVAYGVPSTEQRIQRKSARNTPSSKSLNAPGDDARPDQSAVGKRLMERDGEQIGIVRAVRPLGAGDLLSVEQADGTMRPLVFNPLKHTLSKED